MDRFWRSWHILMAPVAIVVFLGCLIVGLTLIMHPDLAADVREERGAAFSTFAGVLFLVGAVGSIVQLWYRTRSGRVYVGRTSQLARSDDPLMYKVWCFIQVHMAVALAALGSAMLRVS